VRYIQNSNIDNKAALCKFDCGVLLHVLPVMLRFLCNEFFLFMTDNLNTKNVFLIYKDSQEIISEMTA